MSGPRPLRFFFDYVSPNAYVAWVRIHALAARHELRVDPVPVLYAGILDALGLTGPAELPAKARWMWRNVARKAALLDIPLAVPRTHPFNPLLALRVSSLPMDAAVRARLIGALFGAVWAESRDVGDPATVSALATAAGLDGASALEAAATPEAKRRLFDETRGALDEGVFGVPTLIVEDQLFWGYDDFPWLERWLAGEDRFDRELLRAWSDVRPSAWRRGRPRS